MKLLDIQIDGFGKLSGRHIVFGEDTNLVYGQNEAGKSTLHALIKAMFFGMKRARGVAAQTDTWSHYKPWNGDQYRAVMRVSYDGHVYRITRDFLEDPVAADVYDETSGNVVSDTTKWFRKVLCGLNENSYDNSISIGQLKSASDEAMAQELKAFIINMDTTGNKSLNASKAKAYLREQREQYVSQLTEDTGRTINTNLAEIRQLEEEMSHPEYVSKVRELSDEIEKLSGTTDGDAYLFSKNFIDLNDVEKYSERVKQAYDDYKDEEENGKQHRSKAPTVIALIIVLLAVAGAVYGYMLHSYAVIFIAATAAMVALVLFIVFNTRRVDANKAFKEKQDRVSELLKRLTGNAEVSEDNLNDAAEKIQILKSVASATDERKKQYEIQNELMEKIRRLKYLREENENLKEVQKKNKEAEYNIQAIDIAIETIDELAASLKDSFGVYLNKEASEYVKAITGGIYTSMSIGDDLNVYMNTKDKMVPVDKLSSGTADQIYLAVRLACAKLMQSGPEKLPLIFDDSFVNYDEGRLASALVWIVKAYDGQIIIFSCHTREAELLRRNNIDFNEITL